MVKWLVEYCFVHLFSFSECIPKAKKGLTLPLEYKHITILQTT
jgi:hypothetical protein